MSECVLVCVCVSEHVCIELINACQCVCVCVCVWVCEW